MVGTESKDKVCSIYLHTVHFLFMLPRRSQTGHYHWFVEYLYPMGKAQFWNQSIGSQSIWVYCNGCNGMASSITQKKYDIIVCDPPTLVTVKMDGVFDVQRDHVKMISPMLQPVKGRWKVIFFNQFQQIQTALRRLLTIEIKDLTSHHPIRLWRKLEKKVLSHSKSD